MSHVLGKRGSDTRVRGVRVYLLRRKQDGHYGRKLTTQRWVAEIEGSGKVFVATSKNRKGAIIGLRRLLGAAPGQSKEAAS